MVNMLGARFGTHSSKKIAIYLLFGGYGWIFQAFFFVVSDPPLANFLILQNQNGHNYKTQDMND